MSVAELPQIPVRWTWNEEWSHSESILLHVGFRISLLDNLTTLFKQHKLCLVE